MNIIHLEANQFTSETRTVKKHKLRKLVGKPKHREDMAAIPATFWGHCEDKQNQWCLN